MAWKINLTIGSTPRLTTPERRRLFRDLKKKGVKRSHREIIAIRKDLNFFATMRLMYGDEEATFYIWGCLEPCKPPEEALVPITEGFTPTAEGFRMFIRRMKMKRYGAASIHQIMQYALHSYLVGKAHGVNTSRPFWTKLMYWICAAKNQYRHNRVLPFFQTCRQSYRKAHSRKEKDFAAGINASLEAMAEQEREAKAKDRKRKLKKRNRKLCKKCNGDGWYVTSKGKQKTCKKCKGKGWRKRKKQSTTTEKK